MRLAGRIPVNIDQDLYDDLKLYSKLTNRNITAVVREALKEWYQVVAEPEIEERTGMPMSEIRLEGGDGDGSLSLSVLSRNQFLAASN